MKCRICGTRVADDATFCPNCGLFLNTAPILEPIIKEGDNQNQLRAAKNLPDNVNNDINIIEKIRNRGDIEDKVTTILLEEAEVDVGVLDSDPAINTKINAENQANLTAVADNMNVVSSLDTMSKDSEKTDNTNHKEEKSEDTSEDSSSVNKDSDISGKTEKLSKRSPRKKAVKNRSKKSKETEADTKQTSSNLENVKKTEKTDGTDHKRRIQTSRVLNANMTTHRANEAISALLNNTIVRNENSEPFTIISDSNDTTLNPDEAITDKANIDSTGIIAEEKENAQDRTEPIMASVETESGSEELDTVKSDAVDSDTNYTEATDSERHYSKSSDSGNSGAGSDGSLAKFLLPACAVLLVVFVVLAYRFISPSVEEIENAQVPSSSSEPTSLSVDSTNSSSDTSNLSSETTSSNGEATVTEEATSKGAVDAVEASDPENAVDQETAKPGTTAIETETVVVETTAVQTTTAETEAVAEVNENVENTKVETSSVEETKGTVETKEAVETTVVEETAKETEAAKETETVKETETAAKPETTAEAETETAKESTSEAVSETISETTTETTSETVSETTQETVQAEDEYPEGGRFNAEAAYKLYPDTLVMAHVKELRVEDNYYILPATFYHSKTSKGRPLGEPAYEGEIYIYKDAYMHYLDGGLPIILASDAVYFLPELYMERIKQDENGIVTDFSLMLGDMR